MVSVRCVIFPDRMLWRSPYAASENRNVVFALYYVILKAGGARRKR
jgi:hypothetical protein